ncbi:MAG: hypothetical protein AAF490_27920 [Chloroflexota bacterium]
MDFNNAKIVNLANNIKTKDGIPTIVTNTGSMWGKGNSCSDIILFPPKYRKVSIELSLDLFPQFDGEQAGVVLFVDSDNYVKFVREMVSQKHVLVLAKELAGKPASEIRIPFESSRTNLKLKIEPSLITIFWNNDDLTVAGEKEYPNWLEQSSEFQIGLFTHGQNPNNEATFYSLSIDGATWI